MLFFPISSFNRANGCIPLHKPQIFPSFKFPRYVAHYFLVNAMFAKTMAMTHCVFHGVFSWHAVKHRIL